VSQNRIVVFEIRFYNKSLLLYRPALHGNWNALSLNRRALKDKFPTPTVPLTTVLQKPSGISARPCICRARCVMWLMKHNLTISKKVVKT
jgi:hypothetical protein